jgi:hypothetical protein
MGPKLAVFTITGGRTGTTWLSRFLGENLKNVEVHHEQLGPGSFGYATPGLTELCDFNQLGQTKLVREFWMRKFALIELSTADVYVETNHQLCKAGLLENLDLCPCPVSLVVLQRDQIPTVSSYISVNAFCDSINMWLWFLSPTYSNNIVPWKPYEAKRCGVQFWYYHEMFARQRFYYRCAAEQWLRAGDCISGWSTSLAVAAPADIPADIAEGFFELLGLTRFRKDAPIVMPDKCNAAPLHPHIEQLVLSSEPAFPPLSEIAKRSFHYSVEKWCDIHNLR